MNEMNFYTLNGEQYEVADKKARENNTFTNESLKKKADIVYANQAFASSIPITMTDFAVSSNMVSPVEHEVGCKVESLNKIPYPYKSKSGTRRGITYTIESDGRINVNGTVDGTGTSFFVIFSGKLIVNEDCYLYGAPMGSAPDSFGYQMLAKMPGVSKRTYYIYDRAYRLKAGTVIEEIDIACYQRTKLSNIKFSPMISSVINAEFSKNVPDLTVVTVSRLGKNICPNIVAGKNSVNQIIGGKTLDDYPFYLIAGNTYTLSFVNNTGMDGTVFSRAKGMSRTNEIGKVTKNDISITFVAPEPTGWKRITVFNATSWNTLYELPQLELSSNPSPYEPFKSVDFPVNKEGIVSGVVSTYPSMTILSDNPNVAIEATYNADTKKYIDSKFTALQAAILSTGGNV